MEDYFIIFQLLEILPRCNRMLIFRSLSPLKSKLYASVVPFARIFQTINFLLPPPALVILFFSVGRCRRQKENFCVLKQERILCVYI
jgi:hypothetical protein